MNVPQVSPGTPFSKNYSLNQSAPVTAEQAASFEATLNAPPEATSSNDQNPSQEKSDSTIPEASWDVLWKGFNQSIFDHNRREFAYYDRKRREIDYGNNP